VESEVTQLESNFVCFHNLLLSVQVDRSNHPIVIHESEKLIHIYIQNYLDCLSIKIKHWLCSENLTFKLLN